MFICLFRVGGLGPLHFAAEVAIELCQVISVFLDDCGGWHLHLRVWVHCGSRPYIAWNGVMPVVEDKVLLYENSVKVRSSD